MEVRRKVLGRAFLVALAVCLLNAATSFAQSGFSNTYTQSGPYGTTTAESILPTNGGPGGSSYPLAHPNDNDPNLVEGPISALPIVGSRNPNVGGPGADSYGGDDGLIKMDLPSSPDIMPSMPSTPKEIVKDLTSPDTLVSTLEVMLLLTLIALAPSILMMTTSFVRIIIVLGFMRQAMGAQQMPPAQVVTTMALFLSMMIMAPTWQQVYDEAIVPYQEQKPKADLETTWERGIKPIRNFMIAQIERANNTDDIWLFLDYLNASRPADEQVDYKTYEDVPLTVILSAFMLSELTIAFLIGFQLFIPFLILDMVIASVMVSMGMLMLPPVIISMPFKLLLFVLLDGWQLVVDMLLKGFQPYY